MEQNDGKNVDFSIIFHLIIFLPISLIHHQLHPKLLVSSEPLTLGDENRQIVLIPFRCLDSLYLNVVQAYKGKIASDETADKKQNSVASFINLINKIYVTQINNIKKKAICLSAIFFLNTKFIDHRKKNLQNLVQIKMEGKNHSYDISISL